MGEFARDVQIFEIASAVGIADDPSAEIMCGRDHRNSLRGDVDAERKAAFINGRKMLANECQPLSVEQQQQPV